MYRLQAVAGCYDSEMKRLTRKGVGVVAKQDEEEIIWEKVVLGDQDQKTLLHTLVFLFGKYFALKLDP